MGINDEIREQQKKLKGKSFKEKWGYFWDYYKTQTLIAILAVVLLGSFIWELATAKEDAFSATLLNAYGNDMQSNFQNGFAEYAGIDTNAYGCLIDASSTLDSHMSSQFDIAVFQRTIAMTQTSDLDVMVGDAASFTCFAKNQMFLDLRQALTGEEYARYEPYFYYMDSAVWENDAPSVPDTDSASPADDGSGHADPSLMEAPVPVGIYLPDNARLREFNCYTVTGQTPVLGFVFSSKRLDASRQFLRYLTE
jgi:hypothetical protein